MFSVAGAAISREKMIAKRKPAPRNSLGRIREIAMATRGSAA